MVCTTVWCLSLHNHRSDTDSCATCTSSSRLHMDPAKKAIPGIGVFGFTSFFWGSARLLIIRVGNSLIVFLRESLVFCSKNWANEQFAKIKERFTHALIFGERPEQIAHIAHFGDRFTNMAQREWANRSTKMYKKIWF